MFTYVCIKHSEFSDPFDFYMFHFAYHLINPFHQRSDLSVTWNTVYYALCSDYIIHFLPTEPGCEVMPIINYTGKIPAQSLQLLSK